MANITVDLFLWNDCRIDEQSFEWPLGAVNVLSGALNLEFQQIYLQVESSQADYFLFWSTDWKCPIPDQDVIWSIIAQGIDLAHAGLNTGMASLFPDLSLISQDWSMINAPDNIPSNNWRVNLNACLIRRELFLHMNGLDDAYASRSAAGLDLGYRSMRSGALVEYRPEIIKGINSTVFETPSLLDFYVFLFRNYKSIWAKYVLIRHWASLKLLFAWNAYHAARKRCRQFPQKEVQPVWFEKQNLLFSEISNTKVSVIIPTLGRYPYLKAALDSLRTQTIKPAEVIIVDQNPIDQRQSELYGDYKELNLKVVWQNERGQSLARNTALTMVTCPYVLFFEDDAIAYNDLIEVHLRNLLTGRFHVSTGVSIPPPPSTYQLPFNFRYPRIAQTFSTGNSMVPYAIIRELGGFDRNYDFGPGTDADFGTRLYLAGYRIIHDPRAVIIHYKAPIGGLRTFRVHKIDTDLGWLQPFPPVTQTYYGLRYLNSHQQRERIFMLLFTSKFPLQIRQGNTNKLQTLIALLNFAASILLLPVKWIRSYRRAKALMKRGIQTANF